MRSVIHTRFLPNPPELFVVIGPDTFSAGTAIATEIEQHADAVFVGEPTGGSPNSFGDLGRIRLPNSGIEVRYSRWGMAQSTRDDHRPAIFPHIRAPFEREDYVAARDPVLQAIRAYEPKKPLLPILESVLAARDMNAVITKYHELKSRQYNEYIFSEWDLSALGYALLEQGRTEEAVTLFELYRAEYPWSPNAYDSLGDAYRASGQQQEARAMYRKAFEIDKQYSHSRDKLLRMEEKKQ